MADIWLVRKRLPQAGEGVAAILSSEGRQRLDREKGFTGPSPRKNLWFRQYSDWRAHAKSAISFTDLV